MIVIIIITELGDQAIYTCAGFCFLVNQTYFKFLVNLKYMRFLPHVVGKQCIFENWMLFATAVIYENMGCFSSI